MDFKGTITLSETTLVNVIIDVCKSLAHHGFRKIILVNGHGGNVPALKLAAKAATNKGECAVIIVNWWRDLAESARKIVEETPGGHAAEDETSEVMHIRPDLVDMTEAVSHRVISKFDIISGSYRDTLLPSAMYGDPRKATPDKGRLIMEQAEEELIGLINELERGKLPLNGE